MEGTIWLTFHVTGKKSAYESSLCFLGKSPRVQLERSTSQGQLFQQCKKCWGLGRLAGDGEREQELHPHPMQARCGSRGRFNEDRSPCQSKWARMERNRTMDSTGLLPPIPLSRCKCFPTMRRTL